MGAVDFALGALGSIAKCSSPPLPDPVGVLLHPHFTEDSFVFWLWSGGANLARYVPGRDEKICHHH